MFKEQKGITLVALVITIIVLLILAGVSISLVVGQNGVLGKAQDAVTAQKAAEVKQAISLSINSADAYWGSKFATDASYTRKAAYMDTTNGVAAEMAKQGYTMTELSDTSFATDTTTANMKDWTITSTSGNDKFVVKVALTANGEVAFGDCTITTK